MGNNDSSRRLSQRLKGAISLSRAQAFAGFMAAILSIGGSVFGYLKASRLPDTGTLVAFVREVRTQRPLPAATVEVYTRDALVTSFPAGDPAGARRDLKEGTYRVRVSHPRFTPESRAVHVVAGHISEVRIQLAPRIVATPSPPPAPKSKIAEAFKKIFE